MTGPRVTASGILVTLAVAASLGVLVLAIFLPVVTVDTARAGVQPRQSLVAADGWLALIPAAIPLAWSGLVAWLIRVSRPIATVLSALLLLAAFAGFVLFIIGVFVIPVAVLLLAACVIRSDPPARQDRSRASVGSAR